MTEVRAVVDASSLVSAALLPHSVPRTAFDVAVAIGRILSPVATIAEIDDVLRRPKFEHYLTEQERLEFIGAFVQVSDLIEVTNSISVCRDPKDNKYLELALCGQATHIISSDADLLTLHPFQ